jgi:hypothetical protein
MDWHLHHGLNPLHTNYGLLCLQGGSVSHRTMVNKVYLQMLLRTTSVSANAASSKLAQPILSTF